MSRRVKQRRIQRGKRKDKGVVCPETEEITKTAGSLIYSYRDKETA